MKRTRILVILGLIVTMVMSSVDIEAKKSSRRSSSRAKTSQSSKSRKSSKSSKHKKSSNKSAESKSSRRSSRYSKKNVRNSKGRKSSSRRVRSSRRQYGYRPFATFETKARPTINYVNSDSIYSLRRKSANGNHEAQYLLGCAYLEKKVRDTSRDSMDIYAARYWQQAADGGHATAMGDYAYCLRTGRGVQADTLAAIDYYTRSLLKGNGRLLSLTRQNAERGSGLDAWIMSQATERDKSLAASGYDATRYAEIALNSGFTQALLDEAKRAIAAGDKDRAITMLKKIKSPNDDTIDSILDMMRQAGDNDLDLLRQLAETDYPDVQLRLGQELASLGKPSEAAYWMKRAAQNGSDIALADYTRRLVKGQGVSQDLYQAYMWLDVAADSKPDSIIALADKIVPDSAFIDFARGMNYLVREDYASALPYFTNSYSSGATGSQALMMLCDAMSVKKSKAPRLLKKLADKDEPLAAYAYSLYKPKDAVKLLKKAADSGSIAAMDRLGILLYDKKDYLGAYHYLIEADKTAILSQKAADVLSNCFHLVDQTPAK